jgi:hypothetical protein
MISSEMQPDSQSNYLPGATLPGASTIEEKQNLLLNMLLIGAVKLSYPREVLEMFGVNCQNARNYVLLNYHGLLLLVKSLLTDLEKAGSIRFKDDVIDEALRSVNMGDFDFDRFFPHYLF